MAIMPSISLRLVSLRCICHTCAAARPRAPTSPSAPAPRQPPEARADPGGCKEAPVEAGGGSPRAAAVRRRRPPLLLLRWPPALPWPWEGPRGVRATWRLGARQGGAVGPAGPGPARAAAGPGCAALTQLPMSLSLRVTDSATPPPPHTRMLALSGSRSAAAATCRLRGPKAARGARRQGRGSGAQGRRALRCAAGREAQPVAAAHLCCAGARVAGPKGRPAARGGCRLLGRRCRSPLPIQGTARMFGDPRVKQRNSPLQRTSWDAARPA
jgi:hypothetical protein